MASAPKKSRKRPEVDGWSPNTVDQKLKNMHKGNPTGDWRRDVKLHNFHHVIATTNWSHNPTIKTKALSGPVPVGMENLLRKMENAQNSAFKSIPLVVKEEFRMTESSYSPKDYFVSVLFSEPK